MKNNTFFLNMKVELAEYSMAKSAARERKERAVNEYGWDSEEFKAAYDEEGSVTFAW